MTKTQIEAAMEKYKTFQEKDAYIEGYKDALQICGDIVAKNKIMKKQNDQNNRNPKPYNPHRQVYG